MNIFTQESTSRSATSLAVRRPFRIMHRILIQVYLPFPLEAMNVIEIDQEIRHDKCNPLRHHSPWTSILHYTMDQD